MDISYLRDFVRLAENCHFQKTAEELYLSQAALSRHISSLEKELGTTLFDRTTRKIELNEFGSYLLPYAKEITRIYGELTAGLSHRLESMETLTIGSVPSLYITALFPAFKEKFPNCHIQVVEENNEMQQQLLLEGKCDFAVLRRIKKHQRFPANIQTVPFRDDAVVAVLPKEHRLAPCGPIRLPQLEGEDLIFLKGGMLSQKICETFAALGMPAKVSFGGMHVESVVDMVANGLGVAFLLKSSARSLKREDIVVAELEPEQDFFVEDCLAYVKTRKKTAEMQYFLDIVKEHAKGSVFFSE